MFTSVFLFASEQLDNPAHSKVWMLYTHDFVDALYYGLTIVGDNNVENKRFLHLYLLRFCSY